MSGFFVRLYDFFERHRALMYALLFLSAAVLLLGCLRLKFNENITSFLPNDESSHNMVEVFDKLEVSDKFVLMLSSKGEETDFLLLDEAADSLESRILRNVGEGLVRDCLFRIGEGEISAATDLVYGTLPFLLTDADYERLDSLLRDDVLPLRMKENMDDILSPGGMFLKDYILRDPLGIAVDRLTHLSELNAGSDWQVSDSRIYSPDGSTMMCFVTPQYGMGFTGDNDALVSVVESELESLEADFPDVRAEYFAGPAVGVYNARQIKRDTFVTSVAAILLIMGLIFLTFKKKSSLPLVLAPVLYGMLFSLGMMGYFRGGISAIAVGSGAVVMGIALSYSIHIIAHQIHVDSTRTLIRELAFPLTVGSITTIGAFLGLLFTSSGMLRDFGLFASLTLVGTLVFSLVFLPHFLRPMADVPKTAFMKRLEKFNGNPLEKKTWLLVSLLILFAVCLFTSGRVEFNPDMMSINYMPEHLAGAGQKLDRLSGSGGESENIMFISVGGDLDEACVARAVTDRILDSLQNEGLVSSHTSARGYVCAPSLQKERIGVWNRFWSEHGAQTVMERINAEGKAAGFRDGAFSGFSEILSRDYSVTDYVSEQNPLLENWVAGEESLSMLISRAVVPNSGKDAVYSCFDPSTTVVFDRSWFASDMVRTMNDDLNLILWISSALVFIALCLSYGSLEIAVLSFLPMLMSWVIIIGLMGIFGFQFNIVSIILSTFIFGIGDDFSIFMTDGLISRYALRREVLASHKSAIFLSTFTIVAGMGVMIVAKHPALHSIGAISIIGMMAVVLVAFTLQPLIFNKFVIGPTSKGRPPYTFSGALRSMLLWAGFVSACLLTILSIPFVIVLPLSKLKKQRIVRMIACKLCRLVIRSFPSAKGIVVNPRGEDFSKPSVVVSNHTSYLDIVWMLALSPKLLILAKQWVRKVPIFYPVAKFLGFYYADEGYSAISSEFAKRVEEGWSLAVFPEGTRQTDGKVHRFHKGAFYIAESLGIDIVPVAMYGNDRVLPKHYPMNMAPGYSVVKVLDRIPSGQHDYRMTAKITKGLIVRELDRMSLQYATLDNNYWKWALLRSMLYKGAGAEWETRIDLSRLDGYRKFDEALPREGRILHLGCGRGQIDFMLKMLAPGRTVVAVDSDPEKIRMAQCNYLCAEGIEFVCADPDSFDTSGFDAVFYGKKIDL
ncbi:MAG: 1-acyl-sn-glycerol-3-phosphate acyltransferase [Candidatus Cryptobacteroides sp.]